MNDRSSILVLLVTGGLLVAGTLAPFFSPIHGESGAVKVVFEKAASPAQPVAEPLFPGQP